MIYLCKSVDALQTSLLDVRHKDIIFIICQDIIKSHDTHSILLTLILKYYLMIVLVLSSSFNYNYFGWKEQSLVVCIN